MKKQMQTKSHEFAIYDPGISQQNADRITICQRDIVHRIMRVLRLHKSDEFILFDKDGHTKVRILSIKPQAIECQVVERFVNRLFEPSITFLLPILKKDALSDAMYYLVEAGVNRIQLVQTNKQQRRWGGDAEHERLERVAISAAEQAKHFAIPSINDPLPFSECIKMLPDNAWYFYGDPDGESVRNVMQDTAPSDIILTCGPEGDFTEEEKDRLQSATFQPICLTPTILRAETAALCLSSLFRSVFS